MAVKIQLRRDVSAAWTSANTLLSDGEIGLETDTGKIKIGDGVTRWASLDYFVGAQDISATLQGNAFNGVNQLVKLDGTGKLPAIDGSLLTGLPSGVTSHGDLTGLGNDDHPQYAKVSGGNNFTGGQSNAFVETTNAIDFTLGNNFLINATAANITIGNATGCTGRSGDIIISNAGAITGWGAGFSFKNIPTGLTGEETFSYVIKSPTEIKIGRVQ